MTAPAQAVGHGGPIAGDSLVNVQISNLLNNLDVSVTVPIQVAANVCDVNVAVLTETLEDRAEVCDAGNTQWTITDQAG